MNLTNKLIYIIIFFCFTSNGYSQVYDKLLGNENYWYITTCSGQTCQFDYYFAIEDTLINGKTYRFLDNFHYLKNMMLYEDTIQRRVYMRSKSGFNPNKDVILYDFSLTVGQSMEVFNPNSPLPNSAGFYTLDSIVTKNLLDGPHRFFYLSENLGSNTTVWIEGIGSQSLINTPSQSSDINGVGDLSCFYKDGVYVFQSDTLPAGQCDTTLMVGQSIQEKNNLDVSVFPNPTTSSLYIDFNKDSNYRIITISGRLVKSGKINSKVTELTIENLKSGVYFLILESDNQILYKKVIKN